MIQKMTTLTPSYHAEQYSPDDNRFDLRPFLYPPLTWAYNKIAQAVDNLEAMTATGMEGANGGRIGARFEARTG